MTVPDVSVVIALHDAVPDLTACLASLAGQTIGPARMEAVVVDDGSTDGSGAELARFAARHPGLFRTVRQEHSGGPAAVNRGTALARGRYLFHLGAGDRLGAESLERMVAAADRWQSDVLIPRPVGGGDRRTALDLFDRSRESVTFTDSALAWSLADTKLFRRELVVRHGLRRREDLPVLSEQPYTLAALLHARKVSVLADHDHHHPAPRAGRSAAAGPRLLERLRGIRAVQESLDALAPPGPVRDAVRARSFGREVPQLLQTGWLAEPPARQRRIAEEVATLLDRHCPPGVFARLPVPDRLRLALAARGELGALRALIAHEAANGAPPVVRRGGRAYAAYPGFRDRALGLPDALFELPARPAPERPGPGGAGWRRAAGLRRFAGAVRG
ncbi:glycosyltransferase family 2 protein [Kitasatospora terrestris]|uniref:Glycosyltransferase 2-like domain-containing protein n=1 Tax=Kitasatospora terrestris TaxID=258051 RepID=A0ABP9DPF0_9ACTN